MIFALLDFIKLYSYYDYMKKRILCLLTIFFYGHLFAEKPIIQNLQAIAGNSTKINVIWTVPEDANPPINKLFVYRDIKPISNIKDIEKLEPVAILSGDATSYTDTVKDYKDYFYAVLAYTDDLYDVILPTINSLTIGTHLTYQEKTTKIPKIEETEKLYPEGSLREKPLPYIDYIDGLVPSEIISEETIEKSKKLSSQKNTINDLLDPFYFEEDLVSPDGGDDYLLFDILKNYFVKKDYIQSIDLLQKLVGTNINPYTQNRAYFYIGEALYLSGNYAEAVKTFVKVKNDFPILAKKWIDSSLDHLVN